jgi:Tripartite tricarboxylate transporter TctB family
VLKSRREIFAGGLMSLFGLAALLEGRRLGTGTLSEMGPGFVPMALGVVLCGLGLIIALTGQTETTDDGAGPDVPDLRGAICILAGAVGFIVLGQHAGLAPAIFGSVFIAAMGDRTTKIHEALLLAAGVTLVGSVLFGSILKIPIPIFGGR